MIIQELSTNDVALQLVRDEYASWTYSEAKALAEYLEELSNDLDEPIKLDIVEIRCEWASYTSFKEVQDAYPDIKTMDDLYERTTVIELDDGGLIIQQF